MRTFDVAYVPHGTVSYTPKKPLEEMDLREIVKNYLVTCVKSQGKVSECLKCTDKCEYGKRAEKLAKNIITPSEATPYEGSILQKGRMENELIRKANKMIEDLSREEAELKNETKEKTKKHGGKREKDPEGWYEESLASENQLKWVMDKFSMNEHQAKKKIWNYRYYHPEVKTRNRADKKTQSSEPGKKEETKELTNEEKMDVLDNVYMTKVMERKLEKLMNEQEMYETEIKKYKEEYERKTEEVNLKLSVVKEHIDAICKTMDIFKE